MSVTKEKWKNVSTLGRTAATECEGKYNMPGAQQPQAYGNDEIITLPPPFSSDVLIEQYRGKLLSEEVLHKFFHEFCYGQTTNDRGYCTGNIYILREGGRR